MMQRLTLFFLLLLPVYAFAQQTATIYGTVKDEAGNTLYPADVIIETLQKRVITNEHGAFQLQVPSDTLIQLRFQFPGTTTQSFSLSLRPGENYELKVFLNEEVAVLDTVTIHSANQSDEQRREASSYTIDPKIPKYLPSAFGDFNKILVTLPGVYSNSELSSQYNVRGGNYDENLIYVNDMEIYKPYLVRGGQQEGLSFINPDLVKEVEFSAGGWQPRYGDKLSSVLSVRYKVPYRFKASATASLLGASFHLENVSRNERFSYIIGARQKSAQYLLNTLPVKGEYKPRFVDVQSYFHFDLTRNRKKGDASRTTLGILTSIARNRYYIFPGTQQTNFGTQFEALRLTVDFEGKETLEYTTLQTGVKLSHRHSEKLTTHWTMSAVRAGEREYNDVEGVYKLSEVEVSPNSSQFNQSIFTLGEGTMFDHARNKLTVSLFNVSHQGSITINSRNKFQWGGGAGFESLKDKLTEYSFIDSAGYVTPTEYLNTEAALTSYRLQGFAQHALETDSQALLSYGVRINYWSLNNQLLISPRIQYSWKSRNEKDIIYKVALGVYQQPPFYRELRDMNGVVHKDVKAQSSVHVIVGRDYNFRAWERTFKFTAELYGKYLWNINPYDIDNVRIRYYSVNNATAYVAGADLRVNGEFVRDLESWFSLGVLTTREDVKGDSRGYIRRPTDQRINASILFQDHLPKNPSIKAFVNLVFGSGLPFGAPGSFKNRSMFSAPPYRRVDMGFSKLITYTDKEVARKSLLESIWMSFEVLNVLGVNNTISYLWITAVNNNRYPVPNTLSARFVNLRVIARL